MYYFILMYIFNFLLISCTGNYIHCDEKPVTFRLIFKYLRTFKIFIEDIKKYCKLYLILPYKINVYLHLIFLH